ncbi:polyphosphate glucokinase [Arthrobacter sp. StoSoilA2]|nr:polyphosphate glucokinase [Arthrobacter sp. StoSoilA2]BCW50381.1 polyphosphate glucokinase [Arthrobacter sp. StoSoilB13]
MDIAFIRVDIGGTGIKGGLGDKNQGKNSSVTVPTPHPATPEAVAAAVSLVIECISVHPQAPAASAPVGVTFPGIIRHGVVHSAANMEQSWLNTDINQLLSARLCRPVQAVNGADPAGNAEISYRAGMCIDGSVLAITLGTGIVSALFLNGQLVPNSEFGHLEVDGVAAEKRASAVARERDGLSWKEYSDVLQRCLSHLEFFVLARTRYHRWRHSQHANDYLPNLKLGTAVLPATLRNDAGIVGAALQATIAH